MELLDAMASGMPVIGGDNSAQSEVCGDAALLVNVDDADELAHAMLSVAQSADLRKELARKGREQAGRFTWEKAAEKAAIYLAESIAWQGRRRKPIPAATAAVTM